MHLFFPVGGSNKKIISNTVEFFFSNYKSFGLQIWPLLYFKVVANNLTKLLQLLQSELNIDQVHL